MCVVMCDINCNRTISTTVILIQKSSSNQTCPGDTVTYTCVTDTGELVWRENNSQQVLFAEYIHSPQQLDIFTVNLTKISGMVIESTATISNVLLQHNSTILSCSDNAIPHLADTISKTVIISSMILHWHIQKRKNYCNTFMFFM